MARSDLELYAQARTRAGTAAWQRGPGAAMGVRALLEERYNFDTVTWLVLVAALAMPLSLWVLAQQRLWGHFGSPQPAHVIAQ